MILRRLKLIKFGKIIAKIGTHKKLSLFNLEFSENHNNNTLVDNCNFACRFPKNYKHLLHSENIHLNGITDLILSLGLNLEHEVIKNNQSLSTIHSTIEKKTELLNKLTENLDYIRSQNNQIISELKEIRKSLAGTEVKQQIHTAIKEEDLDKLVSGLDKFKITKKPKITPYKHWLPRK